MRIALTFAVLLLLTGCASKFDGEWIESRPSDAESLANARIERMAISFHPPSLARVGLVSPRMEAVDAKTVQESGYFLFDGWQKAQLGTIIAKVDGDQMTAVVGSAERTFVRVKGKSIFPPRIVLIPWG